MSFRFDAFHSDGKRPDAGVTRAGFGTRWLPLAISLALACAASASAATRDRTPGPLASQAQASSTINAIQVFDVRSQPVRWFVPTDTFFVDVTVTDTIGFRNVADLEVGVFVGTSAGVGMSTWQGARFLWQRTGEPSWSIRTSKSDGWRLLAGLCSVDTLTNAATPQRIRFAISPCVVARADSTGWQVQAWTSTVTSKEVGFGMRERIEWAALDGLGRFAAGAAGATGLPLSAPSTGQLRFRLVSNTPLTLTGLAGAFEGVSNPAARFGGGEADTNLAWVLPSGTGTTAGHLDSVSSALGNSIAALIDTAAVPVDVVLRLSLPAGVPAQVYRSTSTFAVSPAGGSGIARTLGLEGVVLGSGIAAHAALAEVEPHRVPAGTVSQPMLARLAFAVGLGETGVNRVRVALPAAWASPRVTGVFSALGLPLAFHDASTPGSAIAALHSTELLGPLRVYFTADVPAAADSTGAGFVTYFDDTTTTVAEQVAVEGNPDLVGESGWYVVVEPAAAARIEVVPATAALLVGDTLAATATVTDSYGNRRGNDPVTWSASGGAGSVSADGRFAAQSAGVSFVIGRSGALADTSLFSVTDPSASTQVSLLPVPVARLFPAGAPVELARMLVQNMSLGADTVNAVEFVDVSRGPVTGAHRGGSWSAFELRDTTGARLATGLWSADRILFDYVSVALPPGSSRRLHIFGAASARARDGDSLGLALDEDALPMLRSGRPAKLVDGASPALLAVDGMSAAQVSLRATANGSVFAGTRRRPVAELHVPANGYANDRLLKLNLLNFGSAEAGADLERIEAWRDDGDHALDTLADQRLGNLSFTGDRWELTGLAVDVPDSGACLLLSVDVSAAARDGRTLRFALPTSPDVGLGMASGNSGPIDREVLADHEVVIGGGERLLVTATQGTGGVVHAGRTDVPLLELVLTNGYVDARHLRSLVLTNESSGSGTPSQLDASIARVTLGLRSAGTDAAPSAPAPFAVGSFVNGRVTFDGLDLTVPPGDELRLYVTADVDDFAATDGDRLAVSVSSPQDIQFAEPSTVGGGWPARSGANWQVDGFIAAQATVHALPGLTLAPGDGAVPMLDVRLPGNGYLGDVLHSVRVVNLGDADPAEIAELRLARDGGDGRFGGGAPDDVDLGPLVSIGGQWQSAYLAEPVPAAGNRYFVSMTVSGTTSDSSLVRLAIPVGGVEMESGNDGPLDGASANPYPHVLSTRPLLASLELVPASSTIGQQVDLRMSVRNAGSEPFVGIAPGPLVAEGTAAYQLSSGPTPAPVRLAPGESAEFTWTLTPTSAGELRFAATATGTGESSLLVRHSLAARSGQHPVYMEADSLRLLALQSMPSAVNRGQTGIVPLTLTLEHPGDASSSDILFRRLRVRLEQEDGSPIAPADLATAVEVREGTTVYLSRTSLETSGDEIDLTLSTPATLRPGDPVSLSLRLDIASATSVPSFRLVVDDSSGFAAEDAVSRRPVRVRLQDQSYPIRSGLARLLSGGGSLVLAAPAPVVRHASSGQARVAMASWQLSHSSSQPGSADLRLNALHVRPNSPGGLPTPVPWTRWRVIANGLLVCVHEASASDTGEVRLDLVPAPVVQPGATVGLLFEADLAPSGAGASFALDAVRTSQWDVRDVNSGDPAPLVTPAPVSGDTIRIEAPATELAVSPLARMPGTVAAGRTRLPVLDLVLRHPGSPGSASVRVDSVRVALHAPDGRYLAMDDYLGALRLSRRGIAIATLAAPSGGEAVLVAGVPLEAAAVDTLTLEIDVVGDAPSGVIELRVASGAIRACDANTGVSVTVIPEPPAVWPFGSGGATLVAPARELRVSARSRLPALVPPGGSASVVAASLVLYHPGPAGTGAIVVDHVVVSAGDDAGAAIPLGSLAAAAELRRDGVPLAQSAPLAADSATATLTFAAPLEVAPGDSAVLELGFQPRAADPAVRFRVGWQAGGIGVVQPASALLAIAVLPAAGSAFPLWTETSGFAASDLGGSYTNYPNPFAAGRGVTTFAFLMPGPGRVTLRIRTPRGLPVVTLLESAALPAGLRQAERWDGRNGQGDVVANGVYVAELEVRLDDGRHERVLRKVAVVR